MKIAKIIEGNLYVTASGETVLCSAPSVCLGVASGMLVYLWGVDGDKTAETRDDKLRPASMREQRDFWRIAYETLCRETAQ